MKKYNLNGSWHAIKSTVNRPKSILSAQSTRQQRLALADDIIDNSGELEELEEKIKELHEYYLGIA